MKVAHLINSLDVGGAESLVVAAMPYLLQQCDDATLVTLYPSSSPALVAKTRGYASKLRCLHSQTRFSLRTLIRLEGLLRTLDVDIVHVHLFPSLYYGALLSEDFGRVAHEHSVTNGRRKVQLIRPLERAVYGRYDRILCVGQECHDSLLRWLPSLNPKLAIVPNGIDLEHFRGVEPTSRSDFDLPTDSPLLIAVGRLVQEKDHRTLITAMLFLPGAYLCIVGDGPEEGALRRLVRELGLEHQVRFLGFRTDIDKLLSMSDIFISSSMYEGCSLAVVEAMAAGLPVIATDAPGLREMVEDNETGLLVAVSDPARLAEAVSQLLKDASLRHRLIQGGLRKSEEFRIDRTVALWMTIYRDVLAQSESHQGG